MNTLNPYLKQYKKNQVETATPEQILILLYDGAIQYLNKAKFAIEENDPYECSNNLFSCQKIVLEFMNTLNMEVGGDLAQNLYNLYGYMLQALIDLNISKNVNKLDEIMNLLKGLRETWQKAIVMANAEKEKEFTDNYSNQKEYDEGNEDDEEDLE